MPDISMCKFKECPIGEDCFRLKAKPNGYQSYADFKSEYNSEDRTCWYKIKMRPDGTPEFKTKSN